VSLVEAVMVLGWWDRWLLTSLHLSTYDLKSKLRSTTHMALTQYLHS